MASKLRIFISSTMDDLGNERRAVAHQLRSMGIEPVYAEEISPDGRSSWEALVDEIKQSHIFVLLLGERYGTEPSTGYGGGTGYSVTHLEFITARESKKLILPFFKVLDSTVQPNIKRNALRTEVSDWGEGVGVQSFEWADDLAQKLAASITRLWTNALLKHIVRESSPANVDKPGRANNLAVTSRVIARTEEVLIAGAGMSISAGYPTALLLMGILAKDLWSTPFELQDLLPYKFSELATYYEIQLGRIKLERRIQEALDTPNAVAPTYAHLSAVRLFKNIITTNHDRLFELACESQNLPFRVINPFDELSSNIYSGVTIFKIVGTADTEGSLVLTEEDLDRAARKQCFSLVKKIVENNEILVIGHSLRDGNIRDILKGRDRQHAATFVSPKTTNLNEIVLTPFGFQHLESTADEYFNSIRSK
ncbi:DUF4062 domain-containing protein [Pseudomonas syringae]|uniref:DUF4062 domain-containing protein n=1 Tax=Pseudomonas syringae TaxID=317 RepID=UPI0032D9168F